MTNLEKQESCVAQRLELVKALDACVQTYRTFRNVPPEQMFWGSSDEEVLEQAFAVLAKHLDKYQEQE